MIAAASPRSAPRATLAKPVPYYIPLPRRLAEDLRDSPVAIGVYCLIGRLYRITREPVPLSPGDLRALDPTLSYGAATRALRRLADSPFVIVSRARGRKSSYVPTWGAVRGAQIAWELSAPCLGRPRHIVELRLDQRLLDTCLGRMRPHTEHPAIVERYIAQPLLGLEEVGAYAAALAGIAPAGGRLRELGLLHDGRPQPLPDDTTLLALASQRALGCCNEALTAAGWARTAFRDEGAPAPTEGAAGQALFFVPTERIGQGIGAMIADPIAEMAKAEAPWKALGSEEREAEMSVAGSHVLIDQEEADRTTPGRARAGGGAAPSDSSPRDSEQAPSTNEMLVATGQPREAETPAMSLLRELGVRRAIREQLRGRSREQVSQVIAQGRARGDVRDLAGWVVSALRELPQAPATAQPRVSDREILLHPRLTHIERSRWLTKFRNAELAERPTVLERFRKEHPVEQLG